MYSHKYLEMKDFYGVYYRKIIDEFIHIIMIEMLQIFASAVSDMGPATGVKFIPARYTQRQRRRTLSNAINCAREESRSARAKSSLRRAGVHHFDAPESSPTRCRRRRQREKEKGTGEG